MKNVQTYDIMDIISYKHDGELHRVWKNVCKIYEDDELVIIVNNKVWIIHSFLLKINFHHRQVVDF